MPRTKTFKTVTRKRPFTQRVKDALSTLIDQQNTTSYGQYSINIVPGQPVNTSKDFVTIATEAYGQNPWYYTGVSIICDAAAVVPIKVIRDVDGEEEDVENHVLNQILKEPNGRLNHNGQSWSAFQETWLHHVIDSGNAYIHDATPGHELNLLRPDLVSPVPGKMREMLRYEYRPDPTNADPIIYKPEEVIHSMLIDPVNSLDGISPGEAGGLSIDLNNTGRRWNNSKLENSVGLGGVFFGDEPLTENQIEQIEGRITNDYSGPSNAAKWALLDGVKGFERLSESPQEMDWFKSMEASSDEILATLRVPKVLVVQGTATYENLREAKKQLYSERVIPLLNKLIEDLNYHFEPIFPGYKFKLDVGQIEVLQENYATKAQWIMPLALNRVITVNEAREKLGFETRPDCDVWLEPTNLLIQSETEPLQPPISENPVGQGGAEGNSPITPQTQTTTPGNGSAPPATQEPAAALMETLAEIRQKMQQS